MLPFILFFTVTEHITIFSPFQGESKLVFSFMKKTGTSDNPHLIRFAKVVLQIQTRVQCADRDWLSFLLIVVV